MSRYIHRALCAFAAAAIISPLSTCGHDAPVPHSAQPGVEQSPQMPNAGTVPYGHHYPHPPASDPSAAYPHPPSTHEPHGYGDPHHPLPPNNHENAASAPPPPQYALWEQSSGTTELLTHSWHPPLTAENLSQWDVAMATVPSGEHLVLLPGDANRTGQFWHRNAIPAMQFEPVLFRVIVGDQGVVAQIRESVTSAWATACSLDHVRLHPHGFIGFTGHNRPAGQVPHAHQHPGDQVVLYFVKTWSMEPLAPTQHTATPQLAAYSSDEKHVATEPDAHLPHNEQYGIYSDFSHPSSYAPPSHNNADQTVMGLLQSIGNQISMLSMEVDELRQDLRKHWGDEGPEAVKSLKSELTGFKDLFKRHSQQHSSALNTIHKHVETKASSAKDGDSSIISRLTDLSSQIEKDVTMRYANSFLLSMAALVLVILFALCSWRKFHDIEKKHML
ncbi:putative lectin-domain protein [Cyclospora cayetanensis]|uniref:Lectin-domain protein n=1 Tax=Cyclospora cayetanensis TaxID=88456 RepID=A0A1D3CSX0_9EIME|nr:putative lectin-domain protein [Cyclospora cayetanensis]